MLSNFFINDAIDRCFRKFLESIDNFLRNGSGWSILSIEFIDLHVGIMYRELSGGCSNIQLPAELKKMRDKLRLRGHQMFPSLYLCEIAWQKKD